MAALKDAVKAFIVQRLACYESPTEVVLAVKEEFGVELKRQHVESYDPDKMRYQLAAKWITLHAETRKAFIEKGVGLAITHRSWRLSRLERMSRKAEEKRNYKLAADLLRQAAKEEGDMFVNKRAKPVESVSEEERVQRMRSQIMLMDTLSAPATSPAPAPTLTVERGAVA